MADKTLGQKIRDFRTQAGFSQFELELQAQLAAGSLSRIEKDKTNPTKETLLLIVKSLNLDQFQSAELFNLDSSITARVLQVVNEFAKQDTLDAVLQVAADQINFQLDYISSSMFLLEGDTLWAKTFGMDPISVKAVKLMPFSFKSMHVNSEIDSKNILLRAALDKRVYESVVFNDFTRGVFNPTLAKVIAKMTGFRKGLAMPILLGDKSYGSVFFAKRGREKYDFELPVLEQIATQLAIKIESIRQIEHFKLQLQNAK